MDEAQVVELMKSSTSEQEWNDNCAKVKKACGGYPSFWYPAILASGLAEEILSSFGSTAKMTVQTL